MLRETWDTGFFRSFVKSRRSLNSSWWYLHDDNDYDDDGGGNANGYDFGVDFGDDNDDDDDDYETPGIHRYFRYKMYDDADHDDG